MLPMRLSLPEPPMKFSTPVSVSLRASVLPVPPTTAVAKPRFTLRLAVAAE
ncbi:hypothetical protein D3C78_1940460 [compost metagenome]